MANSKPQDSSKVCGRYKLNQNTISSLVQNALESVDLGGYGERTTNSLSGGEKQRVAIAGALVTNPKASTARKSQEMPMQLHLRMGIDFFCLKGDVKADSLVTSRDRKVCFAHQQCQIKSLTICRCFSLTS